MEHDLQFLTLIDGNETVMDFEESSLKLMFETAQQMFAERGGCILREHMDVFNRIGLSEEKRKERLQDMLSMVEEAIMEIMMDGKKADEESCMKLEKFIDHKLSCVNDMLSALHLDKFTLDTSEVLLKQAHILKNKFEELKQVKDERECHLQKLKQQRDEHCSIMDHEPKRLNLKTNIPSEEELCQLQSYVQELLQERKKRLVKIIPIKKSLVSLFQEMEHEPQNDFEKMIVGLDQDFILSEFNIEKALNLQASFEKKKEDNIAKKEQIFSRLDYLFSRLEVSHTEKNTIVAKYPGFSDKQLSALETQDLPKYELLRKERMSEFILKLIPEVKELWSLICMTDEECIERETHIEKKYLPESEELLEAWEAEMKRCQEYLAANQEVYDTLTAWRTAWEIVEKIEVDEKNPDRYKSRKFVSTNFMKEQQQKKQNERLILKYEKALTDISHQYDREGTPFSIYGFSLEQYVQAKRNDYEAAKENERLAKKNEKAKQTFIEAAGLKKNQARGGNYVPRTAGTPSTPSKRTAMAASREEVSPTKLRRNNSFKNGTPLIPRPALVRQNTITKGAIGSKSGIPSSNMQRCPSELSILSINEQEFQAGIVGANHPVNSTAVRPNTMSGSVTKPKTPLKDFFEGPRRLEELGAVGGQPADRFVTRRTASRRNLAFDSDAESPMTRPQQLRRRSRSFNDLHRLVPAVNSPGLVSRSPSCMNLRRNVPKLKKPETRRPFR